MTGEEKKIVQGCRQTTAPVTVDPADEFRDFAYIVSHDMAGPVRSIIGFSELLTEAASTLPKEEDRLHLELVMESAQKLNEMIQGLLAFSRLNTVARAPGVVDLEMIVARCHMELQPKLDATGGTLIYPPMPEVIADPNRMFTVFYALVDNAIKFRRDGLSPEIRVLAVDCGDVWEFGVSDNGIGIDPMFYDDIFRPLRKLHTDDAYPGVGMGLTLARKIVAQHGGTMSLEPSPSGGTTVWFSMPKMAPKA
ncbi:MAG: ATP-binding protein [Asticcacaulis sp.]